MPDLRFGVLGPLEVFAGGRPIPVPAGRRRAVLACLLVRVGRPVPVDTLVEAGWGADLPGEPRAALNTVLSRLRAVLGDETLIAHPAGYLLDVPASAVDAQQFEVLARESAAAEPAEAARLLHRALGLWRGPAYAEFADTGFAMIEAQRLERLRLDTIEARAAAMIDGGDAETAVATLEVLLVDHPFREHAVELLLTALYQAGRQADALDRYRTYRALLSDELGLDPSPVLTDLEARILGHDLAPPRRHRPEPPAWLDTSTAFVGRDNVLADVVSATATNRLVTVTGFGGVGKSRLVAEALPLLGERLQLPITVVELASVSPGRTGAAVADALGLRSDGTSVVESVVEYLGAAAMILVLDNCEHLLDEVGPLVALIARRCARVHVLATSRHRLGPTSELVLPLGTLTVPAVGDTAERQQLTAAVRLFADRVRRLRPTFGVTTDNADHVAHVCRSLDGLPLALELAASRAADLGVAQVRERLPANVVDTSSDDLYAVVDWSYRLLNDEQRRLLACLSVFAGDFDADAVQGMTGYLDCWSGDATEALAELAESSLITAQEDEGVMCYRMLVIVRAFASQRLVESDESASVHQAHAEWVREVTEQIARDWQRGDGALVGARLHRSRAEIAVAVECALRSGQLELAASIAGAVMRCLHWTPGLELSELITEVAERGLSAPSPRVAEGVAAGAFFAAERGELERARRLARAALEMSEDPRAWLTLGVAAMYAGDHAESVAWFGRLAEIPQFVGEGSSSLALLACYADDLAAAHEYAEIALAAGPAGADASHAFARYAAGEVAARTDPDRGAALLAEAAAEADRVGAEQVSRVARVALLALLVRGGRHTDATDLAVRLLHDLQRMGVWPQLWTTVRVVAELLDATGQHHHAAFLLTAADAAPSAPPLIGEDIHHYAELGLMLSARLGERVLEKIGDLAASIPRAQVVDRAARVLRRQAGDEASPNR